MRILSFDISSSVIGWAELDVLNGNATLISHGNIKPPKPKDSKKNGGNNSLSKRLSSTRKSINFLVNKIKPDEVVIEDYAKSFTKGRSTANVIIILSVFNELISLECYEFLKKDCYRYPVITIRSSLSKVFSRKIVSKEEVMPAIIDNCKSFKTLIGKKGKIKKECFDEADAIAVGITHIFKTKDIVNWNL